jgi:hypothetical protein
MTYEVQPFLQGDLALSEVVYIDGVPHVTRKAIGEWLEYAEPRKAIDKILERYPHIERYATTVNLTAVDGAKRAVRVYHPVGFQLVVFESGQPKAMDYKVAVAEFVWSFVGTDRLSFRDRELLENRRLKICGMLEKSTNPFVTRTLLHELVDVSARLSKQVQDIRNFQPTGQIGMGG